METLLVDRTDGIVTITMNRPQLKNAMSPAMFDELRTIFREISNDPDRDRVVVLTGAGGEFCSGADLSNVGEITKHHLAWMRQVGEACAALHDLPQPVIAKVVGVAAGAGCNLALGCDLVVASDDARFSEIFAKRGLSIDFGGSYVLPRLVGLHKAKELARIDRLERVAWRAWQRSCRQKEKASSRLEKKLDAAQGKTVSSKQTEARDGNAEYLKRVEWCISKRCELLKLNPPQRLEHGGSHEMPPIQTEVVELTRAQRFVRLAALLTDCGVVPPHDGAGGAAGAAAPTGP